MACGLVNRVVPDFEIESSVRLLAGMIAANAPLTVRACKAGIREALKGPGERDLRRLAELTEQCFSSADYAEGLAAFDQKRPPRFAAGSRPALVLTSATKKGHAVIIVRSEDVTSPTALTGGTGQLWQSIQFDGGDVRASTIFFSPGARTFWHMHKQGQVLRVVAERVRLHPVGRAPADQHRGRRVDAAG